LIDNEELSRMKSKSILVNTSRGSIVNTLALAQALRSGKIAAAGIDVLPIEPASEDEPLIQLWREADETNVNLIITPHTAFYSAEAMLEIRTKTAMEVARALRGEKLVNCVNSQWLSNDVRRRVLVGIPPTV
jgi:lactate dehydrogenase-like 2-hydroxyacid dehydrogenase